MHEILTLRDLRIQYHLQRGSSYAHITFFTRNARERLTYFAVGTMRCLTLLYAEEEEVCDHQQKS